MRFNDYQAQAAQTAIFPQEIALLYISLAICGEAGEIAEKVKKAYRDDGGKITPERLEGLKKEAGDCLWYLAMLCRELDVELDEVAVANLAKLADRQKRAVLAGSGDNR
jgi:NTP pyrophosphatase (non-canonical NTP hydrolase)